MPTFDAGTVVEPLAYKFSAFSDGNGRPLPDGTIREPSDEQIRQYLTDVKAIAVKYQNMLPEGVDPDDPAALLAALDPEAVTGAYEDLAGIYAALCSGEPSKETLMSLPPRIRTVFFSWLQAEVMSPEAAPGGGNAQVTTLRSAAAG